MKKAFTLIEMLVSILIILVLLSILIPVVNGVKNQAKDAGCISNLRTLWLETSDYARDHSEPDFYMVSELKCPRRPKMVSDSESTDFWYVLDPVEYRTLTNKNGIDKMPGTLWAEISSVHDGYRYSILSTGELLKSNE